MTIEEAYEKAKEYDYDGRLYAPAFHSEWLDPSFWQYLAKALGWEEVGYRPHLKRENGVIYVGITEYEMWKAEWHRFIDHLADGGTPESFFESLQ
jgi:hypothetical protein